MMIQLLANIYDDHIYFFEGKRLKTRLTKKIKNKKIGHLTEVNGNVKIGKFRKSLCVLG